MKAMPVGPGTRRLVVLLAFCAFAYFFAPFTLGGKTVTVPEGADLDAILATLVVADGIDQLLAAPASFYDTAILYPDRTQLRSTEPFLGFALIGLPLRTLLGLSDSDVYEVMRWLLIVASLTYAYLLFTAIGVGPAMAVAGAVLCWSHRELWGIERLQVLSIPLVMPVLYHGLMVWQSPRPRPGHRAGLFVFAALYPLCGAINATIAALAGLLALPSLLKALVGLQRERRLASLVVPIVLAGAVDALLLAPWLFDRADLAVYASEAFLQVKHWNPVRVPARPQDIPLYAQSLIGPGMGAALSVLLVLTVARHGGRRAAPGHARGPASSRALERWFVPLIVSAATVAAASLARASALTAWWLGLVFHVVCWGTLLVYWRRQLTRPIGDAGPGPGVMWLSLGLGLFLCLMAFGPIYVSNPNALASSVLRVLLEVLPPLKLIREFHRLWLFGALALTVYLTVRLEHTLRGYAAVVRLGAAAIIVVATIVAIAQRPLVASADIEAPRDLVELVSRSDRQGAVYVHPEMIWNSRSGVFMIAVAREVGRPIVNGYLGIGLPWFTYASSVLHRFPDPEALWLLQRWKVATVVSRDGGTVADLSSSLVRVFDDRGMTVWEIEADPGRLEHPSTRGRASDEARVETAWSPAADAGEGTVVVAVPAGFETNAIEIHFGQSIVQRIPDAVAVWAVDNARRVRLNQGDAGRWIESLAADALVRRESPVATIALTGTDARELLLEFATSNRPLIERIVLLGRTDSSRQRGPN